MSKDKCMNAQLKNKEEVLLGLVNNDFVAWTFIKLCAAYKYVCVFI
jgi:hypothetical protein